MRLVARADQGRVRAVLPLPSQQAAAGCSLGDVIIRSCQCLTESNDGAVTGQMDRNNN
jgi:hypothetical protein